MTSVMNYLMDIAAQHMIASEKQKNLIEVLKINKLTPKDLNELCEATIMTMNDQKGFSIGFVKGYNIERNFLENYFKGVLVMPERNLYVAKYDDVIAGSIQLVKPHPAHETKQFACSLDNHFVVPWARGHGIAKMLLQMLENDAKSSGFKVINLSVRDNRAAAIKLYESMGFVNWGNLPCYEYIDGKMISGKFYYKNLD
ncbi:GNAT family N-acetyltransferase [Rickettsiales endosymbiont of Stachyamoeba lipophora]|uniref:GNAT family N-acetyltransferase n=1 Tax=Rickettsiales endosymbiont of Stachyamoeba lipophora TaxID=2486578 RepID=UPI000F6553A7|nr:GNAT family N-acetyltransferase [Rickettsiales endosymbiont of Stachyamoeba lipophora]AZL16209.1 GNAT family N-acetyltransferase [Rickettsiales endosymbiont of Stachyamoeba lipophora]